MQKCDAPVAGVYLSNLVSVLHLGQRQRAGGVSPVVLGKPFSRYRRYVTYNAPDNAP
jgi:hypothetical protein